MEERRSSPEEFLRRCENENQAKGRGSLKIFFRICGQGRKDLFHAESRSRGKEGGNRREWPVMWRPHARPQTSQLLNGLEMIPAKEIRHGMVCTI